MTVYQATRAIHVNATDYALGATVPTVTVDLYRLDELGVVQEVPPAVLVPLVGVSAASTADVAAATAVEVAARNAAITAQHTVDNGTYAPTSAALAPRARVPREVVTMVAQACASGHGYTNNSAGGTVNLDDTADKMIGSQSILLTTSGTGNTTRSVKTGLVLDMTAKVPVVWLKCESLANLSSIQITIGDAGFANFFRFDPEASAAASSGDRFLQEGKWQRVAIPWDVAFSSGSPNRAVLTQVQIAVIDKSAGATVLHYGGFGTQPDTTALYPNGVISFTWDDGYSSVYTDVKRIQDQYSFPGDIFPVTEGIDAAGGMTLSNLKEMRDYSGWDINAHAYTWNAHNNRFTSLTEAQLIVELELHRKWLLDNGFSGEHLAYPGGVYDDTVLKHARRYFASGRTINQYHRETAPPADRYRMRCFELGPNNTIAQAQAEIDFVKAQKCYSIFYGHKLAASGAAITWTIADFATLCAYAATQGVAVRKVGSVLAAPY